MQYLALITEDGSERIAGLQFSLVGPEPAGFGIDDLSFSFAKRGQLDNKQLPLIGDVLGTHNDATLADKPKADATSRTEPGSLSELFAPRTPVENEASGATAVRPPASGGLRELFKRH
jgi:hypothetical protein